MINLHYKKFRDNFAGFGESVAGVHAIDNLHKMDRVRSGKRKVETKGFKDITISECRTVNGDHGRIETRKTLMIHYVGWQERHQSQA
jgi:hypothetical protein